MESVDQSKRIVVARCLKVMDIKEDDPEYMSTIEELRTKTFRELHEISKNIRMENKNRIGSFVDSVLRSSHSNSLRNE